MRHFVAYYTSPENLFKGTMHISAMTVAEAQDKFFKWLREQPEYAHMFTLHFQLVEIKGRL